MKQSESSQILLNLAIEIQRAFVVNNWAYAEQISNGKYNTVYEPLNVPKIASMLAKEGSCLSYQLSAGRLKWICFDIDIRKEILSRLDYHEIREAAQTEIKTVASRICLYLESKRVPYLIEFSGNRGVHIWLRWNELVELRSGYALQQIIFDETQPLAETIFVGIDRFPQSFRTSGQLGKGVKLPLSKHKKTGYYSCLLSDPDEIGKQFVQPVDSLSEELILNQTQILKASSSLSWEEITQIFEVSKESIEKITGPETHHRSSLNINPETSGGLNSILNDLASCSLIYPIIQKYKSNDALSEKERTIIVGLLRRLQAEGNENLGRDLLFEFFSNQPNFRANVTKDKLENLKLYPPTCSYLRQSLKMGNQDCETHVECKVKNSPIELIKNCFIKSENIFSLDSRSFEALRQACLQYAKLNDEIDLVFLRNRINKLSSERILDKLNSVFSESRPPCEFHIFYRPESIERTRRLVSLGPQECILSAWFTKILDGLFGAEISPNSYGYRFESSLLNRNLFKPWHQQWVKYIKGLSQIIDNKAFDDYWVVKLDIRGFYDEISLSRLRVKLGQGPSASCGQIIKSLDSESKSNYDSLCRILLGWCREIQDSEKGVPQGPAFARYLAEIYLMQFDADVESLMVRFDARYFRWVDDIFVVTPDETSARAFSDKMRRDIESLSLNINETKAFFGTVLEYRQLFNKYSSESKYFVDKVTRVSNATSTVRIAQAVEELTDLIVSPNGTGIQSENAAFFLTHHRRLMRTDIEPLEELMEVEYGRGSYFKHIFESVIEKWNESEFSESYIDLSRISGFRLEVFLNSLARYLSSNRASDKAVLNLRRILLVLSKRAQSKIARILTIHIMIDDSRLANNINYHDFTIVEIIDALSGKAEGMLSDSVVDRILDEISGLPVETAIMVFGLLMFGNDLSKDSYSKSSDKFFAVILEALDRLSGNERNLNCLSAGISGLQLVKDYHLLCCFCSVIGTPKTTEQLMRVWMALIVVTNSLESWKGGKPYWLQKAESVTIEVTTATTLLTSIIHGDGVIPGFPDKHFVFAEYHKQLVVFLFAQGENKIVNQLPSEEVLLARAKEDGILYLEWILTPNCGVSLYPDKKICLRNIVENNLVILKRHNEILVRQPKSRAFVVSPEVPLIRCVIDERSPSSFYNIVYEFTGVVESLPQVLKGERGLINVIRRGVDALRRLHDFKEKYTTADSGLAHIFTDGFGFVGASEHPAIPVTALSPVHLIFKNNQIYRYANSEESAWSILLDQIKESGQDLYSYDHVTQVRAEQVNELIPRGLTSQERVSFLELFVSYLTGKVHPQPYQVDRAKLQAAFRFANSSKDIFDQDPKQRSPLVIGKAFEIYMSICGASGDFGKRLAFSPISKVSSESIYDLRLSLCSSLQWTLDFPDIGDAKNGILGMLDQVFHGLSVKIYELGESGFDANDTAIGASGALDVDDVLKKSIRALIGSGEDYELVVDNEELISSSGLVVTSPNVMVCRFGAYSTIVEQLRPKHSSDLRRDLVYSWRGAGVLILILVDDLLRAMYEMVRKRSEGLERSLKGEIGALSKDCLEDMGPFDEYCRSHPKFGQAATVLSANRITSGDLGGGVDYSQIMVRWLNLFTKSEASALIEAIAAHHCVSSVDVERFLDRVEELCASSEFFSVKRVADFGGLCRLFTLRNNGFALFRGLDLDGAVARIVANGGGNRKQLVIIVECILSGSQLSTSLDKHYLSKVPCGPCAISDNFLFELGPNKEAFISRLKDFDSILVLCAARTESGSARVKNSLMMGLDMPSERITVEGPLIPHSGYFGDNTNISLDSKNVVEALHCSDERMKSVFQNVEVNDTKSVMNRNIIVRPNSVPKKCIPIFLLIPRDTKVPPLFHQVSEPS
ncbi:MAG: reverse transcriptase domain-containing protein [Flavobacteriales bacterium]|nr:reverse transcriptase domain-containing protein [Flavobacteriales bacterium]